MEVREALRFDVDQLSAYMTSHVDGFHGPLRIRQFRGVIPFGLALDPEGVVGPHRRRDVER